MKVMRAVVAGIVVVSLCGAAFAAEGEGGPRKGRGPGGGDRLAAADADGNGTISLDEFSARGAPTLRLCAFSIRA